MEEFSDPEVSSSTDSYSSNDENATPAQNNRRGSGFLWTTITTLTVDEAKAEYANKLEENCVKGNVHHTNDGTKMYLKCAWHSKGCKKQFLFEYASNSADVFLKENDQAHNHDPDIARPPKGRGLPENVVAIIEGCLSRNARSKPKEVIAEIRKTVAAADEPVNLRERVANFIANWKRSKFGDSNPTIADLSTFAQNNAQIPLGNECEAYVIGFDAPDEFGDDGVPKFRLVFSSQRLLNHVSADNFRQIAADATYKLLWHGYPVFVIGTSDANRTFHPVCIAVCSHETEEDFEFVFRTLKTRLPSLNPEFCLSDAAGAIFNAAKSVWPHITRVMCNSHVYMNCQKKSNGIRDERVKKALLLDLLLLQLAPTEEHFHVAAEIVKNHYTVMSQESASFMQHFEEQWCERISCWYEGVHINQNLVMSNNGIEATNGVIKNEGTYRERMNLFMFTDVTKRMIRNWGNERNPVSPNCISFQVQPDLVAKDYTDAYVWARDNVATFEYNEVEGDGHLFVFFSRGYEDRVTARKADKVLEMHKNAASMQNIKDFRLYYKHARVLEDKDEGYICSCTEYKKTYRCTHSLGALVRQRRLIVPPQYKPIPLGRKRGRGRPAHAASALQRQ
jgi:hypothetical protein